MANSYTTILNMTKPEVGADTSAWGGHLNTNFDTLDSLFEAAAAGTAVGLNMTGKMLKVGKYKETVYVPSAATTFTVDLANGSVQVLETSGNCTITLPSAVAGQAYRILVKYGGVHTLTWAGGTSLKWPSNVTPTASSASSTIDAFAFFCHDTSYTFGAPAGLAYAI